MGYKGFLGVGAVILTFIAFYPYIRGILRGRIKPHVLSWVIWAITTFVVFLAQIADNGGAGAWPIGVSGVITGYVAIAAFLKRSDTAATKADWAFFSMAALALPFWYFTADPLWAVVILTTVDVLGFGPTLRKAYFLPFEEHLTFFALFTVRNGIAMMALEHYSLTTLLFPGVTGIACLGLIAMVLYRRRKLKAIANLESISTRPPIPRP